MLAYRHEQYTAVGHMISRFLPTTLGYKGVGRSGRQEDTFLQNEKISA